jgi:hypothetical protein
MGRGMLRFICWTRKRGGKEIEEMISTECSPKK